MSNDPEPSSRDSPNRQEPNAYLEEVRVGKQVIERFSIDIRHQLRPVVRGKIVADARSEGVDEPIANLPGTEWIERTSIDIGKGVQSDISQTGLAERACQVEAGVAGEVMRPLAAI